ALELDPQHVAKVDLVLHHQDFLLGHFHPGTPRSSMVVSARAAPIPWKRKPYARAAPATEPRAALRNFGQVSGNQRLPRSIAGGVYVSPPSLSANRNREAPEDGQSLAAPGVAWSPGWRLNRCRPGGPIPPARPRPRGRGPRCRG